MAASIERLLPLQNAGANKRLFAMEGYPSAARSVHCALAKAVVGAKEKTRKCQLKKYESKTNDRIPESNSRAKGGLFDK